MALIGRRIQKKSGIMVPSGFRKLFIFLPLRASYFCTHQNETPCRYMQYGKRSISQNSTENVLFVKGGLLLQKGLSVLLNNEWEWSAWCQKNCWSTNWIFMVKPNHFKKQRSSSSFLLTWGNNTGPKWFGVYIVGELVPCF